MPGNVAHPAERTIRRPHIALCSYAMECGAAKVIKRENALKGMPVPLHPGAERYYREVGLLK